MATTAAGASLLDRVRAIAPIIQANAAGAERDRQLSKATVQAMMDAGLYRMGVPLALGGLEADPLTTLRVLEEVSRLDSAAGWNLMISQASPAFCAWLSPEASRAIFEGHPDTILAGAIAPPGRALPVEGGYRVTGRWPFASGCHHASWLLGGAFVFDRAEDQAEPKNDPRRDEHGNPIQFMFVFPRNDVTILDTWHTVGMRGTGSHDIAVRDVFVPQSRAAQVAPLGELPEAFDRPLYRLTIWYVSAVLAAPALGTARAAIDALVALATKKTPSYTRSPLAERPVVQMQVARAEALLGAARAYLYDTVRDAFETASQGKFLERNQKMAIQLALSHAIRSAADAVDLVHQAAGTSAIRLEQPFERYFRDTNVMTQHAFGSASRFESVGKLMFGLETDWPFFGL